MQAPRVFFEGRPIARTMNCGMTRWNRLPLYPFPSSARHSCLKFSAVFGVTSSFSSIVMRPSFVASPYRPICTSNHTWGFVGLTSSGGV